MSTVRFATFCSGIGAPEQAWCELGWKPVFVSEIEPAPCSIIAHHHPGLPNFGDMTKITDEQIKSAGRIDVVCAGTPCQSFSIAGLRAGMADPRGNLALVFLGLIGRIRPKWVVWENVPGVHSSWSDVAVRSPSEESRQNIESAIANCRATGLDLGSALGAGDFEEADQSNDFDCFLCAMEQLGYGVATRILDAQYFGVPQRRRRVFVVGYLGDWRRAAAVLFERHCLSGDSPPSREAGARTSACLTSGAEGGGKGGYAGRRREDDVNIVVNALDAHMGMGGPDDNAAQANHLIPDVCGTLSDGAHNGGGLNGQDAYTGRIIPVLGRRPDHGHTGCQRSGEAADDAREKTVYGGAGAVTGFL